VADFSFTVETEEMAVALESVAPHVDGATAAVISMQTAVVIAERHAAEDICANVNRGFFSLIRSQISQKIAICRSQVDARLLELRDQALKLSSVKITMQRDFQMIAARYTKLFKSLDIALFSRIHEQDTPLLDLVQKDVMRLTGRTQTLQASIPVHQLESVSTCQQIVATVTKAEASQAIGGIARFIQDSNQQGRLTQSILGSESVRENAVMLLPIALVECDSLQTQQPQWRHYTPKLPTANLTRRIEGALELRVLPVLQQMEWRQQNSGDRERVSLCFHQLPTQTKLDERVTSHINRMYAASCWQSFTGVVS
jgi:hypothetical protein